MKRLINHSNRNTPNKISFYWDEKLYYGQAGDTLASALLANNKRVLGRSFKLGRKRGLMAYGVEEPNIMVTLEPNSHWQIPNVKATEVVLYEGLRAIPATTVPTIGFDLRAVLTPLHRFMPVGFYYKIFKFPQSFAPFYSKLLRNIAGFSKHNPFLNDKENYIYQYSYYDYMIVGGGIAGLETAVKLHQENKNLSILLCEQSHELGGETLAEINSDNKAKETLKTLLDYIEKTPDISVLEQTTVFGLYENGLAQAVQKITQYLPINERQNHNIAQKLHHIRATKTILATGAYERPLIFNNNDLPGIMLSSACRRYLNQHNIVFAEKPAIVGNNNSIYRLFQDLNKNGIKSIVVDSRQSTNIPKELQSLVKASQCEHYMGYIPVGAKGSGVGLQYGVKSLSITKVNESANDKISQISLSIDGIAVSGGFNPIIHLGSHSGLKPVYNEQMQTFVPVDDGSNNIFYCGSVKGVKNWSDCQQDAQRLVAKLCGTKVKDNEIETFTIPEPIINSEQKTAFIDFQNDVKVSDIVLAINENYQSIEHIKRYTATGFGTDQGKTSNINAIAVASKMLQKNPKDISTTTYRPPFTGVTFATLSGGHQNEFFEPARHTPMKSCHDKHNPVWEQVGQWYRARYYPQGNENMQETLNRECLAARQNLAMMDVSTLGKIDLYGKDVREFLSRVYTNSWHKLAAGQCRYGIMCDERGMIFDDGVSACINDKHFYMTTTTGGAARVYEHLETWLQTEWMDLEVYLSSTTEQWAAVAVVGPKAREFMSDIQSTFDFSNEKFPFMTFQNGQWGGFDVRIMRISFSGELSYEINVPANKGVQLWEFIEQQGEKYNIVPYGTESMHVLRAEKGFIIVGQDTDGSNTPADMNLQWLVKNNEPVNFIGQRSLSRSDMFREDRKQLIGILNQSNPKEALPEGCAILDNNDNLIGHITSSYYSPILDYSIALAMIEKGQKRNAQILKARLLGHFNQPSESREVKICSPFFYDQDNKIIKG